MTINYLLPKIEDDNQNDSCCHVFDPGQWDRKLFDFSKLDFIRVGSSAFFFMHINLFSVLKRYRQFIHKQDKTKDHIHFSLSKDSLFSSTHYFHVPHQISNFPLRKVKGVFRARVFEGSVKQIPKWKRLIQEEWSLKGISIKEQFVFHTTCPECAQKLGYNYIVIFTR